MSSPKELLKTFFQNEDGKTVIMQPPNLPILGWIVFTVLSRIFAHGSTHSGLHLLAQASLFAWAYLEIRSGESPFRRTLGAIVLASIVISFFK